MRCVLIVWCDCWSCPFYFLCWHILICFLHCLWMCSTENLVKPTIGLRFLSKKIVFISFIKYCASENFYIFDILSFSLSFLNRFLLNFRFFFYYMFSYVLSFTCFELIGSSYFWIWFCFASVYVLCFCFWNFWKLSSSSFSILHFLLLLCLLCHLLLVVVSVCVNLYVLCCMLHTEKISFFLVLTHLLFFGWYKIWICYYYIYIYYITLYNSALFCSYILLFCLYIGFWIL